MASFSWDRSRFNAEGSFNRWLRLNVTANGWPAAATFGGFTAFSVAFDYPDVPLEFPSIAVSHLGGVTQPFGQLHVGGPTGVTGYRQHMLTDVSIWASGQGNNPWQSQLRQMGDMVRRLVGRATAFPLLNIYGATANPTGIGICRFGPNDRIRDADAPMELSPNVHRSRLLVSWYYLASE